MKKTDKLQVIGVWLAKEQLVGTETESEKIDKDKKLANSLPVNNNKEGEEASDNQMDSSDEEDSDNEELSGDNVVLQGIGDSSNEDEEENKMTIKTLWETVDFIGVQEHEDKR